MKKEKFGNIFQFLPKSKIKAGEGKEEGKYPLFTSSPILSKYYDNYLYEGESLIFGTGGQPSLHYINDKLATSTDCFVVQKNPDYKEKVDVKYVSYFLKSNKSILEDGFKGAGLKHISKKYLSNIKIPFPETLEEQIKIANLLTQVETLIAKREESIKLLDELLKSTFLDMFGDPVLNPKGWDVKPFSYFANIDTNMTTDFEKYKYYPHIGVGNIEKNTGKLIDYKLVKDENLISGKYIFTSEHIIYSKIRPNLNKVALPTFDGLASSDSYPILVNKNVTNKYFFAYVLRSDAFIRFILNFSHRANIPKVNKKQLEKFYSYNPPKSLQDKFATIVQQVEEMKKHYQNSLDELNQLFGSLSQRAFKGELDLGKVKIQNNIPIGDTKCQ